MALDLFQLWPVDGGTLVWQVGFVSAPFRVYLGGLDRFIAGKLMMQATLDTIIAFRSDIEKAALTARVREHSPPSLTRFESETSPDHCSMRFKSSAAPTKVTTTPRRR